VENESVTSRSRIPDPAAPPARGRGIGPIAPPPRSGFAAAARLDAYGDVPAGTVVFFNGQETWSSDIDSIDGARFVQVRLTFLNEIATGLNADLSSLGIAFQD